jgi:CHAT domain-containing protein
MFDQTLLLEMGILFLSSGRWLHRMIFLGLFLGLSFPGYSSDFQEDPLYEKVIRNEWIRKADSIFIYQEDYTLAEKYYLEAIRNLKPGNNELLAYGDIKLSNVYTSLEDFDQARLYIRKAEEILGRLNKPKSLVEAEYELYFGKYLLRGTGYFDSAALYIERSIDTKRKYHPQNFYSIAESLFFQAELYKQKQMLKKAEETYREVMLIYETHFPDDNILLGRVYSSLSACLRHQFDFKNALDYGGRAIQILGRDSINNFRRLVTATFFYANTYTYQQEYKSSIPIYQKLLKLIQNKDGMQDYLYLALTNLATAYTNTSQFEKAIHCLNESERILNEYYPGDLDNRAFVLLLYGECYLRGDDLKNAKKYLFSADGFYHNEVNNATDYHSTCEELIGDLYYKLNLPDSALHYYQNALIIYLDNFNNEDIYANPESQDDPDKREIFDTLYKKAKAWRKYYDLEGDHNYLVEALDIYNIIDKLNDQARNSKLKDASLLILSDFYHDGYEMAIDCAWELFRQTQNTEYLDQTFKLMEKSKSMLLFRSLVQAERSKSINLPFSIKQREDSLRMLNIEYEQMIRQENQKEFPNPDILAELETEKFQVIREIENLRSEISEQFPAYYQVRYDSLTKSLRDFQVYCKSSHILGIEYFWGKKTIYMIGSNGTNTNFIKTDRTAEFELVFHHLLSQLSSGTRADRLDEDYRNYIRNAYLGYQYLLGHLDLSLLQSTRLLIIPDGNLAQLPFEALLAQPGDSGSVDYVHLPYLILDKSIGYSYSFNFLQTSSPPRKQTKSAHSLLAFSYSDINTFSENNLRASDEFELFYSSEELNAIRKIMPKNSRFFYGQEATEHQFKKLAPDYELIHLAVHGFADTLDGDNSRLIFKKGKDLEDDSILYMHELYGLDLSNTDLTVLSACESGIGEEFRGEGVFSMARGFFYAGCPSIIMSLWRVSDKYSSLLMGDFYEYLKKGRNASTALREAKLDFIKKQDKYNAHPVHWASFVYLGEEFQYKKQPVNVLLISSIILVLIIGVYILIRLRRSYF